jgi:HPt (histidine-containing phosphotransfer) domain-containing protein
MVTVQQLLQKSWLPAGKGRRMKDGEDSCDVIDRSVLASLRELQDVGDPDIIAEVGGLFIKHSPDKVNAIMQSLKSGDAKGLHMAAHSLKSSSAYVGAMRLSALAKELELMGRSNSLQGAAELAQRLKTEFTLVMAALEKEINEPSSGHL